MALLFLLQVTRESTLLLTFMVVVVTVYHRKWKLAVAAVLITVLGMGVVSRYAGDGKSNIHGASTLVYFVGKVPLNALPNVFGIRIWTNTHAANNPALFPNDPFVTFELPAWLPSGSMRRVGIYNFDATIPLQNLAALLTLLGIVPSLVFLVILWRRWALMRDDEVSGIGQLGLSYGSAAYLLSPALGTSVGRYISYGWPMAWVAAPELLARFFNLHNGLVARLTGLQAIACWTPLLFYALDVAAVPRNLLTVAMALPCHIIAIKLLNRNRIELG
jgi:hypothetical protein